MSKPQASSMYHLTLNTGHVAMQPKPQEDAPFLRALSPTIATEGAPVPGMPGWYLDYFFLLDERQERIDGAAFFQLAPSKKEMSKTPTAMAFTCWDASVAEEADRMARQVYSDHGSSLRHLNFWKPFPMGLLPVPWLAVWLTPFSVLAPPADMSMLGDLEQCIAWTLAMEKNQP